jgi:hypothetical protein
VDRETLAALTGGGGDCLCPACLPLVGASPIAAPTGTQPGAA